MLFDIVISHYNENLKWVDNLKHRNIRHIHIYHKNSSSKIFTKQKFISSHQNIININLPNIGRESHTYLTYCIDNYEDIPDFVFFVQGNPQAHGFGHKDIINGIHGTIKNKQNYIPVFRVGTVFLGLKNERVSHWAHSKTEPATCGMSEWFVKNISDDPIDLNRAKICFGANFGVSKNSILSRPKEDYLNLRDRELSTINPEAGHFMERSWYYFFNLHKNE